MLSVNSMYVCMYVCVCVYMYVFFYLYTFYLHSMLHYIVVILHGKYFTIFLLKSLWVVTLFSDILPVSFFYINHYAVSE